MGGLEEAVEALWVSVRMMRRVARVASERLGMTWRLGGGNGACNSISVALLPSDSPPGGHPAQLPWTQMASDQPTWNPADTTATRLGQSRIASLLPGGPSLLFYPLLNRQHPIAA